MKIDKYLNETTITVDVPRDFETIEDAISYLQKLRNDNIVIKCIIRVEDNYKMESPLIIRNVDMSWLTIYAKNSSHEFRVCHDGFLIAENSKAPNICFDLFTNEKYWHYCIQLINSTISLDCQLRGFEKGILAKNSKITVDFLTFIDIDHYCIEAADSNIDIKNIMFRGKIGKGIWSSNSTIKMDNIDMEAINDYAISAYDRSFIKATNINFGENSINMVKASDGSFVDLSGSINAALYSEFGATIKMNGGSLRKDVMNASTAFGGAIILHNVDNIKVASANSGKILIS